MLAVLIVALLAILLAALTVPRTVIARRRSAAEPEPGRGGTTRTVTAHPRVTEPFAHDDGLMVGTGDQDS